MSKAKRIALAEETLEIIEKGKYLSTSRKSVEITELVERAIEASQVYLPDEGVDELEQSTPIVDTQVELTDETTLEAAKRLFDSGIENIYCLNFASGKNPGGGFINGAQAQEESLARSSTLYPCLIKYEEMYEFNRRQKTPLYSDYMIYSPKVPVVRTDEGDLLDQPYLVSFISAPAVNHGALSRNSPRDLPFVDETLKSRLDKILRIAIKNGHKTLLLGAWGCGIFENDPTKMAQLFKHFLGKEGVYRTRFKHIVYAIYDSSSNKKVYTPFEEILGE